MASQTSILITLTITIFILPTLTHASSLPKTSPPPPHPTPRPFNKIYAFGDSYTDTGNTNSTTGPSIFTFVSNPPYGRTFFHHPTNRYSDGRLVIDFLTQKISLPYLPPYLHPNADTSHGINFAVGGSTAIRHSFFVKNNLTLNITPQSLQTQLNWFHNLLEEKGCKNSTATPTQCKAVFDDALVWVGEIGANDYAYTVGSSVPSTTIQQLAMRSVTGFLQALLNKGATYVVVQGLPATGCLTLTLALAPEDDRDNLGCVASANKQSYLHNTILETKVQEFRRQFPHALIVYADYWNAYRTILKNADKSGLKELFKVCCGSGSGQYNFDVFNACGSPASSSCPNPSEYINWDGVHLTEAMYKVVFDSFLNGTFTRPPFETLLIKKKKSG